MKNQIQLKISLLCLPTHPFIHQNLGDLFSGCSPHTCQVTVLAEKLLAKAINF